MGSDDDTDFATFVDCLLRLQSHEESRSSQRADDSIADDGVLVSAAPSGESGFYFSHKAGLIYAARRCTAHEMPIGTYTKDIYMRLREVRHSSRKRCRPDSSGVNLSKLPRKKHF